MTYISDWSRSGRAAVCGLLVALVSQASAQTTVRLHGAVTMGTLFNAQKQAIESQSGAHLEIVGNGSGRGLVDLASGLADVAMLGGSLKGLAEEVNKAKPGSVDTTGFQEFPLGGTKVAVVTHPSAGVKSLTTGQLRDVLSGKAKNWKEVGGADLEIKVVVPAPGDGVRLSVKEQVMKDAEFSHDAIVRNSAKDLGPVVIQLPGACSFMTAKNVAGEMATVAVDVEIMMPMLLVTKGAPSGDVQKVLDAAKALVK